MYDSYNKSRSSTVNRGGRDSTVGHYFESESNDDKSLHSNNDSDQFSIFIVLNLIFIEQFFV